MLKTKTMTNMKNFAAQQLSKKQMNEIKGLGALNVDCVYTDPQGIRRHAFGSGDTVLTAIEDMRRNIYPGSNGHLDCVWG